VRLVLFLNQLGIGGTEKAACRWARGLVERGHEIQTITLNDGPRRAELEASGVVVRVIPPKANDIQKCLLEIHPDVIHVHAPGHPHDGDILGEALASMPKIPVVQTNIFGRFENPKEDAWIDFRLFISWTSAVQAARRSFRSLNKDFFRRASVAVYPIDPEDGPPNTEVQDFRRSLGVQPNEIVFGRLSRPEPNKWTDLPIESFRIAARQHPGIKLLLREPPPSVRRALETAQDRDRFIILSATSDSAELARTITSFDVVLHTAVTGESFGYGIAEPMNYGKPVITNSTPWLDQAQIELVRYGECGFIASTPKTIADAMLTLANNLDLRARLGRNAQAHIRAIADSTKSTDRLATILQVAASGHDNPYAPEDVTQAHTTENYLDQHQFGHSWQEQIALRPGYYRTRFHDWRNLFRLRYLRNKSR
jgi:glycosyltransferase involved in cell wall biosynthesis